MKIVPTTALVSLFVAIIAGQTLAAEPAATNTKSVTINSRQFTIPVGFELELVADDTMVPRPISADFDERGRLYVTDSSGTNEKAVVQLEQKPHRILRLEDTNDDGRFDKSTVYADKIMFPEGALWHAGSLYVAAPPSIWKFTDTNDDGIADQREEWFQGKALGNCANDLHGPYLGRDGWIYWCKGAWAEQNHTINGKPWTSKGAHIFRCRPDGTDLDYVMTGGMDNPVDVVSLRNGDRVFTTTFFQFPAGGRRDGLIHAIYGGVYGKEHPPIYDHPWTGPETMPVLTHMGPAAPCGLEVYDGGSFGPEFADNLFTAQFNLRKISRHVVTPVGGTYQTNDEDFLVSDHVDFHPTDVLTDADGSLLVIDTGGWYKLCCPTSQFHRPESLGGIYRVRKAGAPAVADPRGLKLSWQNLGTDELCSRLADPRFAVQRRAMEELRKRGNEGAAGLAKVVATEGSVIPRQNAVWTAGQMEPTAAVKVVRAGLESNNAAVEQVALQVASLLRQKEQANAVRKLLSSSNPITQRLAAECLGRMQDRASVSQLLTVAVDATDRARDHAFIYAMIEIGDVSATAEGLRSDNTVTRRRALLALEGISGKNLTFTQIQVALTSTDAALRETAWWIAQRHLDWGADLSVALRRELSAQRSPAEEKEFALRLAKWAKTPGIQELLAALLEPAAAAQHPAAAKLALTAMPAAGLKETPVAWIAAIAKLLEQGPPELRLPTLAAVRALPLLKKTDETLQPVLLKIAKNSALPTEVRLAASAAVVSGSRELSAEDFQFLLTHVIASHPDQLRTAAVESLFRAKLTKQQLLAIIPVLKSAGPLELERLLDVFQQTTTEEVGLSLVEEFTKHASERGWRSESLKQRLDKYGPKVQSAVATLVTSLNADAAKQQQRLEEMLALIGTGDVRRGQLVFKQTKSACTACHAIAYAGGKIGPDLTKIGSIRTERDLLESIMFPSASLVRSFEPVTIVTSDGQTRNGLIRQDTGDEITVVLAANREERIQKSEIEVMKPSHTSIMPAGLDTLFSPQELIDLVTYLKACR